MESSKSVVPNFLIRRGSHGKAVERSGEERGRRSEIRGQGTEDRGRRSEVTAKED